MIPAGCNKQRTKPEGSLEADSCVNEARSSANVARSFGPCTLQGTPCRSPTYCQCVCNGLLIRGEGAEKINPFSGEGQHPQWPDGRARVAKGAVIKSYPWRAPQSKSRDPSIPVLVLHLVALVLEPLDDHASSSDFSLSCSACIKLSQIFKRPSNRPAVSRGTLFGGCKEQWPHVGNSPLSQTRHVCGWWTGKYWYWSKTLALRQLLVPSRMTRIGAVSVLQRITSAIPTWEVQSDEAGVLLRLPSPFSAHRRCPHFLFRVRSVIIISVRPSCGLSSLHNEYGVVLSLYFTYQRELLPGHPRQ